MRRVIGWFGIVAALVLAAAFGASDQYLGSIPGMLGA